MTECRRRRLGDRMIPREILEFLRVPGRSILVKGRAGTGKTLFALALSRAYQSEHGDVVWADSRDTDAGAHEELEKFVPDTHRLRVGDAAPLATDALQESADVLDATTAFAALNDLVAAARDSPTPLLVIDSLDGLTEGLNARERARFVVTAVRLARRLRASLLLVTETAAAEHIDYLVDGIVHARERFDDGVRVRELVLDKLRGIAIPRTAYAFTLANGSFTAFVPAPVDAPSPRLRPHPLPAPEGRISTGTADWDALHAGGLAHGSVHLLQQGPSTGRAHDRLIVPLAIDALNAGRGFILVAPPIETARAFRVAVTPHTLTPREHENRFFTLDGERLARPARFGDDPADPEEALAPLAAARVEHRAAGPVTSVLGLDALTLTFGVEETTRWLARWTTDTRFHGDVDVILTHAPGALGASTAADSAWQLESVHGVPLLRGRVPASEYHYLAASTHRGFPETRLIPVH